MERWFDNNKVYVLGGAQTDFERNWTKEGKGVVALLREAIDDAIISTDFSYEEIERLNYNNRVACFIGNFIAENFINQGHLGALLTEVHPSFYGIPAARYEAACASGSVALDAAITKIRAGEIDVAIVVGWELMKTVNSKVCGDYLGRAAFYEKEALGIDFPFPKLFGKLADEIIEKYSLDTERFLDALAAISTINYANAKSNPFAQTRKWFMNLSHAKERGTNNNPLVGGILAVSDCSQVTDGAAVVILISEKYRSKLNRSLPYVRGFGHRVAPMLFEKKMRDAKNSDYILPWTRRAVLDAYERAQLTVEDIDFFETHDCFSSSEFAAISSFGITKPGKEIEAIEDNRIAFDGEKPINPSGGLIGCGHPVGASGVRMFLDVYKQLNGCAKGYQLHKVKTGLMLNIGGTATTNYVFILDIDK